MVAVKLADIMSGSITFENILSIRVLEWLVILEQERQAILKRKICCTVTLQHAVNRTIKQKLCTECKERSQQRMIK